MQPRIQLLQVLPAQLRELGHDFLSAHTSHRLPQRFPDDKLQTAPSGVEVYLNPDTGRFNRMDPWAGDTFDPQSLHKYAYGHADPVNGIDPSGNGVIVDLLTTAGIVGIVSGLLGATISKATGGSFAEGFFKGLITGSLTTILAPWLGPVLAAAVGAAIAQAVITEWYINGFRDPRESFLRIGLAALLGALLGFAAKLPKMENLQVQWFETLASVETQGLRASLDILVTEGTKLILTRSLSSALIGAVNKVSEFVFAVVHFAEDLRGRKQLAGFRRELLDTFGQDIPQLPEAVSYSET